MQSTLAKMVVGIVATVALPAHVFGAPINYATYLDVDGVQSQFCATQALFYDTLAFDGSAFGGTASAPTAVPERSSVILMGTGLAANAARRRRRGRVARRRDQTR